MHFTERVFLIGKITNFCAIFNWWGDTQKIEEFFTLDICACMQPASKQKKKCSNNDKNNNKLAQHNVDISNWNWYSTTWMCSTVKCNLNSSHPPTSFLLFPFLILQHFLSHSLLLIQFIYFFSAHTYFSHVLATKLNYWNSVVTLGSEKII